MPKETAGTTQDAIVTIPADPQGEAFPVRGEGRKNTNSAGGVLAILLFLFCLFFVAETIVHIIVKRRRHTKGGEDNVSRE